MVHIPTTKNSHMKYCFSLFDFTFKKLHEKLSIWDLKVVTQVVERSLMILLNKNNRVEDVKLFHMMNEFCRKFNVAHMSRDFKH